MSPKTTTVAPPDPVATAKAQGEMNKETAISQAGLNATDQFSPNGSLQYAQVGTWADGTPHYSATQTFSPVDTVTNMVNENTGLYLSQIGNNQIHKLGETFSDPANFSQEAINNVTSGMVAPSDANQFAVNPGAMSTHYTDPTGPQTYLTNSAAPTARYTDASAPASRYTDASQYVTDPTAPTARYSSGQIASNDQLTAQLVDLGRQRLDPALAQQRAALDTTLANKGLKAGSTGYDRSMTLQNQSDNDAYNQLILTGQNQAFNQSATRQNTAQSANAQNYGMDLSGKQFTLGANDQNFTHDLSANNQNFNQDLAGKQFTLGANAQNYGMDLSGANYTLGANQQNYAQGLSNAQYTAGINQQNYGQDLSNATYAQGALAQNYSQAQQQYANEMAQRQQALSEIAAQRNQPLNEIASLMSGTQIQNPTFVNTPNTSVQPIDYTGLVGSIYQGQVSNANSINQANAASSAGLFSGLGSIFGGLTKLSDARAKENIEKLGEDPQSGHGIYAFDYKPETGMDDGQRQIGLMAQDVEKRNPEAVVTTASGYKAVDYGRALSGVGGAFNRARTA